MPATNTDLLRKLSRRWVSQIGSGGVADAVATTIPLSSTTNLATDTAVTLVIDRVDANGTATPTLEETIVGVVSSTNIVNALRGVEGTAQAHSAGAVVEVLVTADGYNDIVDWGLVAHDQLGTHKSGSVFTLPQINDTTADHQYVMSVCELTADRTVALPLLTGNDEFTFNAHTQTLTNKRLTSPKINEDVALTATATELNLIDTSVAGTAVASKALVLGADKNVDTLAIADGGLKLGAGAGTAVTSTAAELNALDGQTGVWTAWTPTTENITVGSGTITAVYQQIGKTINFFFSFAMGSGSAMGTSPTFTLPSAGKRAFNCIANGVIFDSGSTYFEVFAFNDIAGKISLYVQNSGGAYGTIGTIANNVPMTWTTNDSIFVTGTYEAA